MTDLTPLEKARLARQANPDQPRTPVESNPIRKFLAKPTRSTAIKAKCAECMGCTAESIEPGFRRDIKECSTWTCPLHQFRPYQGKADAEDAEDALSASDGPADPASALFG